MQFNGKSIIKDIIDIDTHLKKKEKRTETVWSSYLLFV